MFINLSLQVWLYSILLISGQRNFQRNEEIGFNWVVKVNRVFEQEQIALHYLRLQPTTTKSAYECERGELANDGKDT